MFPSTKAARAESQINQRHAQHTLREWAEKSGQAIEVDAQHRAFESRPPIAKLLYALGQVDRVAQTDQGETQLFESQGAEREWLAKLDAECAASDAQTKRQSGSRLGLRSFTSAKRSATRGRALSSTTLANR